ncbi:MAG TPA: MBL fold metallo-hydrolase [Dehalococcoidia bacterium]|nr:MBL fold metallo-hydrolase [Dehalococcoidia bacterium]
MPTFTLDPVDALSITVLMDNVADALAPDDGPAKRGGGLASASTGRPPLLHASTLETGQVADALLAEHGFSALVTAVKGDAKHHLLFDAGTTPDGVSENMRRLGVDAKDVEVVVLSHGHFDHTTGMDGFIRAVGRPNLPVVIHPEFWTRRRIAIPGRDAVELPSTSRAALTGAGFEIVEERQPSFLFERSLLITGEVDRTTEFERGFPIHQARRDGAWQPDPLILDDQALIAHVRDKGLVVLTGCGHAGVVNIVRYAKKLTGIEDVYAVIGGFHLVGPLFEPVMPPTVAALAEIGPRFMVPAHCTGWRAQLALANALPDRYIQNTVGTRYEL